MSLELLEQLEAKVQSAVDNISLMKMELDEVRENNAKLEAENEQLRQEQQAWQNRLQSLLGRISELGDTL